MAKIIYKDELTQEEIAVMLLIRSEIHKSLAHRLPLKTIRLQPPYFRIFEELNKRAFSEEEIAASEGKYQISKVYIEKGSLLQSKPAAVEYWPMTIEERNINREAIGREAIC